MQRKNVKRRIKNTIKDYIYSLKCRDSVLKTQASRHEKISKTNIEKKKKIKKKWKEK